MQENRSLLELVANRTGERLVQGALLYLLQSDPEFRKRFLLWAGFDLPESGVSFREEVSGEGVRYDIVAKAGDERNRQKKVELKLHTGATAGQLAASSDIDLWIARDDRRFPASCRDKVKTWAALQDSFSDYLPFKMILGGVGALAGSAESLECDTAQRELEEWQDARNCDAFLHAVRMALPRAGWIWKGGSSERFHWGYYLRSVEGRRGYETWLWIGFVRHRSGKWHLCAQSNLEISGFDHLDPSLVQRPGDLGVDFESDSSWRREAVTEKLSEPVSEFVSRCGS